jgi:hypothetical protein
MNSWQWMDFGSLGNGQSFIQGTDAGTLEWLIGEIAKRSPDMAIERDNDADGILCAAYVGPETGFVTKVFPVLRRLLCENGWEPFGNGRSFKRAVNG